MAISVATESTGVGGRGRLLKGQGITRVVTGRITFDSAYPTNGEAISAADLGLSTITMLIPGVLETTSTGVMFGLVTWNKTTGKLICHDAFATEETNNTDLSTKSCSFIAFGTL